jgi:hypothetical protein
MSNTIPKIPYGVLSVRETFVAVNLVQYLKNIAWSDDSATDMGANAFQVI